MGNCYGPKAPLPGEKPGGRFLARSVIGRCFRQVGKRLGRVRLEDNSDFGVESLRHSAEHAQGVTFILGGLQAADLLLGRLQLMGQLLLRQAGLVPKRRNLQSDVPPFPGAPETPSEVFVL